MGSRTVVHLDQALALRRRYRQPVGGGREAVTWNGAARRTDGRSDRRTDFHIAVAPLALILMAYPTILVIAPGVAGPVFLLTVVLLLPLILGRVIRLAWPAVWFVALVAIYALSNQFEQNSAQGLKHLITLISIGTVFLTFATYGSAIILLKWVRLTAGAVVVIDLIAIILGGFPKNATGGAMIYVFAIAIVAIFRKSSNAGWAGALVFTIVGVAIAIGLNFRFLIVCSFTFLIAFAFANRLGKKWYWFSGIVGSASVVAVVLWFFLNVDQRGLAWEYGQTIMDWSGHRANSGRDQLWPYILYALQDSPIFGLGAGTLPRDLLSTDLSAHSYYIQVYLQVGAIGLIAVIGFLLAVWGPLARATTTAGRFGSAVFLMFLVHNATEVLMFQNNALVAVPAWCAIGLALSLEREQASTPNQLARNLVSDPSPISKNLPRSRQLERM